MIEVVALLVLAVLLCYILARRKNPLDELPGPKAYPLVGNALQLDTNKTFLQLAGLAKQYGGIFKLQLFNTPVVVVSEPRCIHEVLVKQSADFAGRPSFYRSDVATQNQSGVVITDSGPAHKLRRKVMQLFLKQFGSGIQKIEEVTQTATDDLINSIAKQNGCPMDMRDALIHCVTDVTVILLLGETISNQE